jgi:hypothetical protein
LPRRRCFLTLVATGAEASAGSGNQRNLCFRVAVEIEPDLSELLMPGIVTSIENLRPVHRYQKNTVRLKFNL